MASTCIYYFPDFWSPPVVCFSHNMATGTNTSESSISLFKSLLQEDQSRPLAEEITTDFTSVLILEEILVLFDDPAING